MPVQYKDYYETLGVPKTATQDEIRKSFRKLARIHHPDVSKDKKGAEAKFKEINEAYEVLSEPEKRQKYDTLGANWERGGAARTPPGQDGGGFSFGGTGFSDFFEQFFAGGRGRTRGDPFAGVGGGGESRGGGDIEADLLVTIEEALHGGKKRISFRRDGSVQPESYEVQIPKGVREGQKIRLAGRGEAGQRGAPAGHLYLRVRFERHPNYRVEGADLIYELELPAWKVVLGTEAEIPTPDGTVRLKIGPGSQHGRKFRIKGRGLPTSSGRGDFFAILEVSLPTSVSDEERGLWDQLSRTWR